MVKYSHFIINVFNIVLCYLNSSVPRYSLALETGTSKQITANKRDFTFIVHFWISLKYGIHKNKNIRAMNKLLGKPYFN